MYLGTPLAGFSGFIAAYRGARIAIQFLDFGRGDAAKDPLFAVGEALLVGLFVSLTRVYGGFAVRSYGRFVK